MDPEARLLELPAYVPAWSLPEAERGLEDWVSFWGEHGVEVEPSERIRQLAARLAASKGAKARALALRELVIEDLARETNQALAEAGRAERIRRQIEDKGELLRPTRWVLATDAEQEAIEAAGAAAFGSTKKALAWSLSTLPLTILFWVLLALGLTWDQRLVYLAAVAWLGWLMMRRWARRRAARYEAAPRGEKRSRR